MTDRHRNPPPQTQEHLQVALTDKWAEVPQNDFQSLCLSMRKTLTSIISEDRGNTNYPAVLLLQQCMVLMLLDIFVGFDIQ